MVFLLHHPNLEENIYYLSEAISLNISNPEIEQAAGCFKVDV